MTTTMTMKRTLLRTLPLLAAATFAGAPPATAQQADPADVATQGAIVTALYDVISGPAGQARDWDRFRSLFIPQGARLIPTGVAPQGRRYRIMSPDDYVQTSGASLERNGFFEREIGRKVEEYGTLAHVFSTYESRATPDAEPFDRGINSIQLYNDGERWWVLSIAWTAESSGFALPEMYLGR